MRCRVQEPEGGRQRHWLYACVRQRRSFHCPPSRVVDSLFVGESENIGNPRTSAEKVYGRSLPEPEIADFPIRGYEFYDYHHELDNDTFVNFQDNATRKTGAISYLLLYQLPE